MSSHEQIDANVLMNGNGVGNGSTVVMDSDRGSTTSRELGYQVHLTSINGMDLDGLSESEIRERFTRTDSITIAARASRIRLPSSDTVMTAPLSSSSSFRGVDGGGHMDNDHDEADDNTCIQNADESRSLLRTVKTSKTENDDLRNEIENYAEYHSNFEQVRIEALEERVLRLESKGSGETLLPQDSFSFFVTGGLWAMVFSCCIFLFQLLFLALLLSDPLVVDWQAVEDWILEAKPLGNFLMLPYSVSIQVRITEGLALLFAAIAQDDIIQACNVIHIGYDAVGHGRKAKDSSSRIERTFTHARKWKWVVHLVMRFLEGFVSLIATFIIIMRERSVVEILLSFASLEFVAKLDDISFKLCEWGFFGEYFREQARTINASKPIEGESKKEKNRCWRHLRLIIMIAVVCFFWLGLALISEKGQKNGYYLSLDFPKCTFERQTIHEIQDGICEEEDIEWSKYIGMYQNLTAHSKYNVKDCGWDGGDCKIVNDYFVKAYSISCTAEGGDVNRIRDGTCDKANNIKQCGYDGGDCYKFNNNENITSPAIKTEGYNCKDCCNVAFPDRVGDGNCNAFGGYNTQECDYDGGDCKGFNANYATTANSNCTEHDPPCCDVEFPDLLGDEECNDGKGGYNTEGCGWDGGDCLNETHFPNCTGIDPARLRDKTCDGGNYNTEECGWDGGDCLIRDYPNCHVDIPDRVRDERCDADANTEECGWDGGDCDSLNVELWKTLPNCTQGIDPRQIKDSICNGGLYNTIECGFDGGACDEFNQNYPACSVDDPYKVGDKQCNGGAYNTTECGYDGGDCVSFSPSTSPSIFPTILPTKAPTVPAVPTIPTKVPSPMPSQPLPPCQDDNNAKHFLDIPNVSKKKGCRYLRKNAAWATIYCHVSQDAKEKCKKTCSLRAGATYESCTSPSIGPTQKPAPIPQSQNPTRNPSIGPTQKPTPIPQSQNPTRNPSLVPTTRPPSPAPSTAVPTLTPLPPGCAPGTHYVERDENTDWWGISSVCGGCNTDRLCTEDSYMAALDEKERELMSDCSGTVARCDKVGGGASSKQTCSRYPPDCTDFLNCLYGCRCQARCEGTCTYKMKCTVERF